MAAQIDEDQAIALGELVDEGMPILAASAEPVQ